ncbi:MAG: acyloxyacyl hydrolase [Verrucomicrobiota bacterium]
MNRPSLFHLFLSILIAGLVCESPLRAGIDLSKQDASQIDMLKTTTDPGYDIAIELGSGAYFGNVRVSDLQDMTIVPVNFTIAIPVDEISLDDQWGGLVRGYTDFLLRSNNYFVFDARESRFNGFSFGPRYNFVQPGWKLIPFAEGMVGFGFLDADPTTGPGEQVGAGQDFNFMFSVSVGARYDLTDSFFLRLAATYSHISNADLSEPDFENKAFDVVGPELSLGLKF